MVAQGSRSSPAAFPPRRGFDGALKVVTISFQARLEKPRLPKVRCGKGSRRWKSRRAETRALRYICRRGWRRDCPSCRRPLRSQDRPRIGRGDRDVARLHGAPRCIGAPAANYGAASTVSLSPIALVTATNVDRRVAHTCRRLACMRSRHPALPFPGRKCIPTKLPSGRIHHNTTYAPPASRSSLPVSCHWSLVTCQRFYSAPGSHKSLREIADPQEQGSAPAGPPTHPFTLPFWSELGASLC